MLVESHGVTSDFEIAGDLITTRGMLRVKRRESNWVLAATSCSEHGTASSDEASSSRPVPPVCVITTVNTTSLL